MGQFVQIPLGWERLVCHGDRVEEGTVLARDLAGCCEVLAPAAGFFVGGDLVPWSIEPEMPDWAHGDEPRPGPQSS